MKACLVLATSQVGIGVQTLTGIEDRDGNPFVGKIAFAINTQSDFDTLAYQTGVNVTATVWNHGADDGTRGCSSSRGDIDQFFAKIASTGDTRRYSVGDYQPDIFFGGNWQGFAYISAFRLGELDLTWPFNNRGGFGLMLVVLGGDDLVFDAAQGLSTGTYSTSGQPVAVLTMSAAYAFGSSATATTGAGGAQIAWGWDTKVGGRAAALSLMINQAGNARGAVTDRMFASISGASFIGAPYVSNWDAASYDVSDGFIVAGNQFAFSGVAANAVEVPLRTTPGQQVIDLQIAARWVKIVAVGTIASATVDTSQAQLSIGWTDGTRQGCAWTGEVSSAPPVKGTRMLSTDTLVRISATGANQGSTAFSAVADLVDLNVSTGELTIDVTSADGTAYQLLVFALGDALPGSPGALLTQLPIVAAYDYAALSPLIKNAGRSWLTPPPPKRVS